MERAIVVGAGLAGCEAAWQLAGRGVPVTLVEMKPHAFTPAHHSAGFAELVCSNSLRSDQLLSLIHICLLPLLVELSFDGLRVINLVHLSGFVFHSRFLSIPSYDFYSIM